MNAPHPYLETDWKGVAMSLAKIITELHPNYAPEVLAVISHHTRALLNAQVTGASPDHLMAAKRRSEYWKAESMAATEEIKSLRAHVTELAEAFTVIWVSDDRAAWDGKAVEHFDALLAKVGGSDTESADVEAKRGGTYP